MKNFYNIILVLFMMTPVLVLAQSQEGKQEISISEDSIISQMKEIIAGDMKKFLQQMETLNDIFAEYISYQTQKCSAPVISVEINEEGEKIIKKKRISKKEKKFCLSKLIGFKISFTKMAFQGRRKYLVYTHSQQTSQLIEFENNSLQELERLQKKYNK